jgi:transposase
MVTLPAAVQIFLCTQPVDARKGIDSLAALVQSALHLDPLTGHLFLFLSRRGQIARLLFWDRSGFVRVTKRLERGRFRLPHALPAAVPQVRLEASDLALLLEGIDLRGATRRPRWQPALPAAAG